jgi:hypothetical protein
MSVWEQATSPLCRFVGRYRWEAIQVHLGRLRLEVRALRRADPPLPKAHGRQAVPVRGVQPQLLALRPPGAAHEEAPELSVCTPRPAGRPAPLKPHTHYSHKKKKKKKEKLEMYILYIWANREIHCIHTKVFGPCKVWTACCHLQGFTHQVHLSGEGGCFSQAPSLSVTVFNKQQLAGTGRRMDGMSRFYLTWTSFSQYWVSP